MGKKGDSKKVFKREDHIDREDLSGEHPYGDSGQIIAIIIFLVIWTLDSFIFRFSTFFAHYVPLYLRLIFAALFFALAGYLARSGLVVVFKEVRDPPMCDKKNGMRIQDLQDSIGFHSSGPLSKQVSKIH